MSLQVDKIKTENEKLNKTIKKRNESINQSTIIIGELSDSLKNVKTKTDTVYDKNDNPVFIQRFLATKLPFYLEGNFNINPPYDINFDLISADINLTVTLTERKDHTFNTYVTSKYPNLIINEINSKIVPYSQSFWKKVKFGVGTFVAPNYAVLNAKLGYKNITVVSGYGTTGIGVGFDYWFK